jgi:hypothetical protein
MTFERFPSLTRFSQGWSISEKIDGTNACVYIDTMCSADDKQEREQYSLGCFAPDLTNPEYKLHILAGSRTRWITPDNDNFGFAKWVRNNAEMLVRTLGEGRHFGEWWGQGIQRGYGLKEKRFSLFNTLRWKQDELPEGLYVVPCLLDNEYAADPGLVAKKALDFLKEHGSQAAPGFMDPEGIVMFHRASGVAFKKTFDYDEYGKWMENKERRNASDN